MVFPRPEASDQALVTERNDAALKGDCTHTPLVVQVIGQHVNFQRQIGGARLCCDGTISRWGQE